MIVEFIGSTGSGKTTLIQEVYYQLLKSTNVTTSFEQVATPFGLGRVTNPTARNLIQELLVLPIFLRSLPRYRVYVNQYIELLARQKKLNFLMFNNLRSLERKLGVFETINRNNHDQIILVDEGTVLSAHHVFVFTEVSYSDEEVYSFASVIPLPDLIVYIRVPLEDLLERTQKRPNPPRMMRSKDRAQNEIFLRRAVKVFEQLVMAEKIQNRLLIVDNPDSSPQEMKNTVYQISEFIINYDPAKFETRN